MRLLFLEIELNLDNNICISYAVKNIQYNQTRNWSINTDYTHELLYALESINVCWWYEKLRLASMKYINTRISNRWTNSMNEL